MKPTLSNITTILKESATCRHCVTVHFSRYGCWSSQVLLSFWTELCDKDEKQKLQEDGQIKPYLCKSFVVCFFIYIYFLWWKNVFAMTYQPRAAVPKLLPSFDSFTAVGDCFTFVDNRKNLITQFHGCAIFITISLCSQKWYNHETLSSEHTTSKISSESLQYFLRGNRYYWPNAFLSGV